MAHWWARRCSDRSSQSRERGSSVPHTLGARARGWWRRSLPPGSRRSAVASGSPPGPPWPSPASARVSGRGRRSCPSRWVASPLASTLSRVPGWREHCPSRPWPARAGSRTWARPLWCSWARPPRTSSSRCRTMPKPARPSRHWSVGPAWPSGSADSHSRSLVDARSKAACSSRSAYPSSAWSPARSWGWDARSSRRLIPSSRTTSCGAPSSGPASSRSGPWRLVGVAGRRGAPRARPPPRAS